MFRRRNTSTQAGNGKCDPSTLQSLCHKSSSAGPTQSAGQSVASGLQHPDHTTAARGPAAPPAMPLSRTITRSSSGRRVGVPGQRPLRPAACAPGHRNPFRRALPQVHTAVQNQTSASNFEPSACARRHQMIPCLRLSALQPQVRPAAVVPTFLVQALAYTQQATQRAQSRHTSSA